MYLKIKREDIEKECDLSRDWKGREVLEKEKKKK